MAGSGACAHDVKKDSGFTKRLFAADVSKQKKSYVCFVRKYDAAHLAGHPLQKVSAMTLLINAEIDPEQQSLGYSFRLGVKFRNRPGDFDSSGSCGSAQVNDETKGKEQMHCGVDCDGGGIAVEMGKTDSTVLVRLDSIRIWRNNNPMTKASTSAAALTIACSVSTACRSKCAGRWSPTGRNWPRCGPSDTDQMIRTR
jgi:hypothetical protein